MSVGIDPVVEALLFEIRKRMPPLSDIAFIPADGTIGPDVTIPAVWMHLILLRTQVLETQLANLDHEGDDALRHRDQAHPDQHTDPYGEDIATQAVEAFGDPLRAASVMIQSAVALLMTTLPVTVVTDALVNVIDAFDLKPILVRQAAKQ